MTFHKVEEQLLSVEFEKIAAKDNRFILESKISLLNTTNSCDKIRKNVVFEEMF